jgi:hypothetical protein
MTTQCLARQRFDIWEELFAEFPSLPCCPHIPYGAGIHMCCLHRGVHLCEACLAEHVAVRHDESTVCDQCGSPAIGFHRRVFSRAEMVVMQPPLEDEVLIAPLTPFTLILASFCAIHSDETLADVEAIGPLGGPPSR